MGKSVSVEIDEFVYQELERLVQERGTRLEAALAEAIEAYLTQRKAYSNEVVL